MEEIQPGRYGENSNWIRLIIMTNYTFCKMHLSGILFEADNFIQLSFIIGTLLAVDRGLNSKNQAGSLG